MQEHIFSESGCDELRVVDLSISVHIHGLQHCPRIDLVLLEQLRHVLHASFEFIEGEYTIRVGVELQEHFAQLGHILSLGLQVRDD